MRGGAGATVPDGAVPDAEGSAGRGPRGVRVWARDLAMGARFAVGGGRQSWTRTLLTAFGVGLGVALLLLAASVPQMMAHRDARGEARQPGGSAELGTAGPDVKRGPHSVLASDASTKYGQADVYGEEVRAEGDAPVKPPGVSKFPGPGEIVASPALQKLLHSPDGKELAKRIGGRVVGTIGPEGLLGPKESAFYKGSDRLMASSDGVLRADKYVAPDTEDKPLDPMLVVLIVVACAVLVMPVAVFVATAVRFGGERRDARLAALRLVGADAHMTRRIAAGESLVGALLGLVLGGCLFLLARICAGQVNLFELSVYPSDLTPTLGLGLLVVLGVPAVSVAVTLFALRGVAIEPLGMVRQSEQRRRRLWWRVLLPAVGLALLYPMAQKAAGGSGTDSVSKPQLVGGVVLLLSGVALLLPWLIDRVVGRLRGGPVSWQLATRRLQLSSGNASRAVSGITIAVAGAIALQMLFSGVAHQQAHSTGHAERPSMATITGGSASPAQTSRLAGELRHTKGVPDSVVYMQAGASTTDDDSFGISVAGCATLRKLAHVGSCHDGQVFLPRTGDSRSSVSRGTTFLVGDGEGGHQSWRLPASARPVKLRKAPDGNEVGGVLATPGAVAGKQFDHPGLGGWAQSDGSSDAMERIRTAVFHASTFALVLPSHSEVPSDQMVRIQRAILAAAAAVMLLIGASMVVTMIEQLRDRKRQLSVLVAFGTKRATLGASVLWQTAVPVVLGLGLAVVFGLSLGWALLRLVGESAADWLVFLPMVGAGAGVIVLVTLVSLPPLWRLMRPDGLRTE